MNPKSSVLVVEGKHDEMQIRKVYPEAQIVLTNGIEVSSETLRFLKTLSRDHEIIIMTDPDHPGEKIRRMVTEVVPDAIQVFLPKEKCIGRNGTKVGVEHASCQTIRQALNYQIHSSDRAVFQMQDLFDLGLIGQKQSAEIRAEISERYHIGNPNAKTFLKRINMLNITKEELKEAVCRHRK